MERILIVDDDERLSAMLSDYLGQNGYGTARAATGAAGLREAARLAPDAVVLDLMLPDMDGLEVCRRLRATSAVPVLMLTARGEETDRIVGLEMGADDYLPKPFSARELLARLRAVLRRAGGAPAGEARVLRFGDLAIDPQARTVTLRGEERALTGHQFDLLHALAAQAGRVLTREQLMERARGESLEAFDRSIDVHVSRIRAAIEDDPKAPRRILTVRGVGYCFARSADGER